jgi:hypothetical protein
MQILRLQSHARANGYSIAAASHKAQRRVIYGSSKGGKYTLPNLVRWPGNSNVWPGISNVWPGISNALIYLGLLACTVVPYFSSY